MADPDLQIRGGGGGQSPDPEIRGGPGLQKIFKNVKNLHFQTIVHVSKDFYSW